MKYPKEYLDEIKNRLKVSTVVSKSVSLKKRGKEYVGLSPFKNEKTPSFTVNDEKEFYHCFATSEHGNIFDFDITEKDEIIFLLTQVGFHWGLDANERLGEEKIKSIIPLTRRVSKARLYTDRKLSA